MVRTKNDATLVRCEWQGVAGDGGRRTRARKRNTATRERIATPSCTSHTRVSAYVCIRTPPSPKTGHTRNARLPRHVYMQYLSYSSV